MGFIGSVPNEAFYAFEQMKIKDYHVGCVGAFKVPLYLGGTFEANDISLLSRCYSAFLNGKLLELEIKEERLKFLQPCLDGVQQMSTVLFLLELADYWNKKHIYAQTMVEKYLRFYELKLNKATDRYLFGTLPHRYFEQDIFDFVKERNDGKPLLMFPPTYEGGYEKAFKVFESFFGFEQPEHTIIGEKEYQELFDIVINRGNYFFYTDRPMDKGKLVAKLAKKGKKTVFLYSDLAKKKVAFYQNTSSEPIKMKPMTDDVVLDGTEEIKLLEISQNQSNFIQQKYLSYNIDVIGNPTVNLLVVVGNYYAGMIGFNANSSIPFMIIDLALPSRYKRLSKLVIMLALCKEAHRKISTTFTCHPKEIKTTVLTDKPVSMKYRDVWELEERSKGNPNGENEYEKYGRLKYRGIPTEETAQEVYRKWFKKYGKITR